MTETQAQRNEELEKALEFVDHGHTIDCDSLSPPLRGGYRLCNCGRDGIALTATIGAYPT